MGLRFLGNRLLCTLALTGAAAMGALAGPWAQAPTPAAFEAATIKPQTGPRTPRAASSPDRFTNPDTTLRNLIEFAYELATPQVAGGPEWMATSRFAVDAKAAGTPSRAEMRLLVRGLLAQRFNLRTHTETRELQVFLLERLRAGGPLGPGMRATPASECAAQVVSLAPREPGTPPPCGVVSATPVTITARGVAMTQFARNIHDLGGMTGVDRLVVDRTGLDGVYNIDLRYRPTETAQLAGGDDNPGFFGAIREQLGLKLTPSRAPVSVLVVDSATQPTAD